MAAKISFFIKTTIERLKARKSKLSQELTQLKRNSPENPQEELLKIRRELNELNEKIKENQKKINTANVLVRFSSGRQFDIVASTQKQINPEFWNNEKGIVRQRADFQKKDEFQKRLNELRNHILSEFDSAHDKSKIDKRWLDQAIDKFYNPGRYLQDNMTLFDFIQNFIDNAHTRVNPNTGNPVCYKMRREYEVTFNYLKEYAEKFGQPDFVDIDLEFYNQFTNFLRAKELKVNTIGKKIQTLKIFLNNATELGINKYQKYKSRNFKSLSEESENIYLTKAEIAQLYAYDLTNQPGLERVRDLFVVGCWTGLRFSDIQQITPEKINGDFIEIKQKKTGKKVVIPIHHTVRKILAKYNGNLPRMISNQKFNDFLKKAAKLAKIKAPFPKTTIKDGLKFENKYPKHELISSHTARRSFCTNAYKDGIPTLAIMAISGHKTEKAFLKYIKADSQEHAKKVLQIWQQSDEFIQIVE
ncbi:site-specific integrase [Sunxiuqinia elliptica]|uniref:Site-specific recombinase XerD n=1 Tax=Sunxiuqinia elliptica TaxID=655355 RepID=A0A4R6HCD5_9BACT|nr:site-specific integrase [Sunxiuqinia elliptica]TDO05441.1 site-specific recombinase XerD [Sunxiuqinia elliptica]TDO64987.1 site-specific recombinase XerD [Sunxiuqinia elliptica]